MSGLGAAKFILEPSYFDLDYLDEFAAFYAASARGYPSLCRRVHYFSAPEVDRALFQRGLAGDRTATRALQDSYLGFSVLRPISAAFGRTVFRWFDDRTPEAPRVVAPSRRYDCHLAGLKLSVEGLAWQQQDSAVASCATVGAWTMLQSSAMDHRHAIPTTTQITLAANQAAGTGRSIFPSTGLAGPQLLEAIKRNRLNPVTVSGDLSQAGKPPYFSKERFASSCAAFIRSGYPVLLVGHYDDPEQAGHVVCAVGFREAVPLPRDSAPLSLLDAQTSVIYLHDDNYGPNLRFKVESSQGPRSICKLVSEPPPHPGAAKPFAAPIVFVPNGMVIATHQELRLTLDTFYQEGHDRAWQFAGLLNAVTSAAGMGAVSLAFSCRFMMLKDYFAKELEGSIHDRGLLAAVRLALQEQVSPMSLHIGIIRIALDSGAPLMDLLYDTTEADPRVGPFCYLAYTAIVSYALGLVPEWAKQLSTEVRAYWPGS